MKILIVSGGFPSKKYPLLGLFELDQARALKGENNDVVLISLDLRSIRRWRKWGITYFVQDGIKVYTLSFPIGAVPAYVMYMAGKMLLKYIYKRVEREEGRPDIVHAHFTDYGAIATILKHDYNLPLVMTEHSSAINKPIVGKRDAYMAKIAYSAADTLISVSNSLADNIRKHFGVVSQVIPNIVDDANIQFHPQFHKSFVFISIGNLVGGKGFDLLINAFEIFKGKDVLLHIVGEGECRGELEELILKKGLERQIILLGYKPRNEISELLNNSDAFVLASRSETFGVVYIEAMLAGLPVIGTLCGGPEDFIDIDNGIMVPVNNIEKLSDALLFVQENICLYDKWKISKQCKAKYSPNVIANRLMCIYNSLLRND